MALAYPAFIYKSENIVSRYRANSFYSYFILLRPIRVLHREGKFEKIRKRNSLWRLSDAIEFSLPRERHFRHISIQD